MAEQTLNVGRRDGPEQPGGQHEAAEQVDPLRKNPRFQKLVAAAS